MKCCRTIELVGRLNHLASDIYENIYIYMIERVVTKPTIVYWRILRRSLWLTQPVLCFAGQKPLRVFSTREFPMMRLWAMRIFSHVISLFLSLSLLRMSCSLAAGPAESIHLAIFFSLFNLHSLSTKRTFLDSITYRRMHCSYLNLLNSCLQALLNLAGRVSLWTLSVQLLSLDIWTEQY